MAKLNTVELAEKLFNSVKVYIDERFNEIAEKSQGDLKKQEIALKKYIELQVTKKIKEK